MAPKNNYDPAGNSSENVEDADFQEMEAVNESLDVLNSALDVFERQTENILERIKALLYSNREIRQELAAEKPEENQGDRMP